MQARTASQVPPPSGDASASAPSRASSIAVLVFALGFTALLGYSIAPHGPAGWHFAMNNIAAADNLLAGRGVFQSRDQPFLSWPPLMPALIALLKAGGLRYVEATLWIAVGSAFATSYFLARSVLEQTGRVWIACAAVAVLAAAPGFLELMGATLSQPLFLALGATGVWLLQRWVRAPSRVLEVGLVLVGMAMSLHRYDGVVFTAVAAATMAFAPGMRPPRGRFVRAGVLALLSYLPLAAWLARNRAVSGLWSGVRNPTEMTFLEQLGDVALLIGRWFVPEAGAASLHTALAVGVALFTTAWLVRELASARRWGRLAFVAFPIGYAVALAALASRVEMDRLSDRLAMPVAPFVLMLALMAVSDASFIARLGTDRGNPGSRRARELAAASGALFVGVHLVLNAPAALAGVRERRVEGAGGFASPKWIDTDLARWLRAHPLEGRLFSNSPELVLLGADRMPDLLAPDDWRERLADRSQPNVLIVSLARRRDERLLERIRAEVELTTLVEFESGGVYRLEAETAGEH
jgi:hypothetical protein